MSAPVPGEGLSGMEVFIAAANPATILALLDALESRQVPDREAVAKALFEHAERETYADLVASDPAKWPSRWAVYKSRPRHAYGEPYYAMADAVVLALFGEQPAPKPASGE